MSFDGLRVFLSCAVYLIRRHNAQNWSVKRLFSITRTELILAKKSDFALKDAQMAPTTAMSFPTYTLLA